MSSYRAMAGAILRARADDITQVLSDALALSRTPVFPAWTPPQLSPAQWEQLYAHLDEDDDTP